MADLDGNFYPTEQTPLQNRQALLDEEQRAWDFGREVLAGWGYENWAYFDQLQKDILGLWRNHLGLKK